MNIFYLNEDPRVAAQEHCDKHVCKMTIEYCQLLSTAHRALDGAEYYDKTKNGRKKKKENTPSLTTLQPLPKSNPTPTSFKNECNDAGWFVQGDSCVPPVEDDTPYWNGNPTTAGVGNSISEVCENLTTEQCLEKATSDPIQLTVIIVVAVIFIGLVGGFVMRGRTQYGSGYQIPRPY